MIDVNKLKYDLALQSAVVMTMRDLNKGLFGNPTDLMLKNFLLAYKQYGEEARADKLLEVAEGIDSSK